MISGRGLGITGGTLDKLESIPGFNIHIDERRALAQLESIGVFMIGQTADICPADKKLYALRDVTGTVPSQPLIVASIMSKKLAENLDRLVLDVKFGSGAFMKTRKEAKQLAASMTKVGKLMGVKVSHLLSPMDEPLGRTVGNALEVAECVEILQGGGPQDVIDLTLDLATQVSTLPRAKLAQWLSDGTAWKKFISLVYAQDGDASSLEKLGELHRAPIVRPCSRRRAGSSEKWMPKRSAAPRSFSAAAGKRRRIQSISRSAFPGSRKSASAWKRTSRFYLRMRETIKRCSPFGRCWRKQSRSANRFTWPKPGIPGTSRS